MVTRQIKTHDSESRGQEEAGRTRRTIKTHDSESRGQEEAGRTRRTSVLFTGTTALN